MKVEFTTSCIAMRQVGIIVKFLYNTGKTKIRAQALVSATLEVYEKVKRILRHKAEFQSRYIDLKDVWRVFSGIGLMSGQACQGTDELYRLWLHEIMRVFGDKLQSDHQRYCNNSLTKSLLYVYVVLAVHRFNFLRRFYNNAEPKQSERERDTERVQKKKKKTEAIYRTRGSTREKVHFIFAKVKSFSCSTTNVRAEDAACVKVYAVGCVQNVYNVLFSDEDKIVRLFQCLRTLKIKIPPFRRRHFKILRSCAKNTVTVD